MPGFILFQRKIIIYNQGLSFEFNRKHPFWSKFSTSNYSSANDKEENCEVDLGHASAKTYLDELKLLSP